MLADDETIINPYYMRQLLQYGIKLGQSSRSDMSPDELLQEAAVCRPRLFVYLVRVLITPLQRLVVELKSIDS
jgi:hypothetical protein